MHRRAAIGALVGALGAAGAGCLDSEDTDDDKGEDDEIDREGAERELPVRVYNYRDEAVSVTIAVETDGDVLISDTVDLEAPETIFTERIVARVPEDTRSVRIDAAVTLGERSLNAAESFDLPGPEPIADFEVRVDNDGLSIGTLGYEQPA